MSNSVPAVVLGEQINDGEPVTFRDDFVAAAALLVEVNYGSTGGDASSVMNLHGVALADGTPIGDYRITVERIRQPEQS